MLTNRNQIVNWWNLRRPLLKKIKFSHFVADRIDFKLGTSIIFATLADSAEIFYSSNVDPLPSLMFHTINEQKVQAQSSCHLKRRTWNMKRLNFFKSFIKMNFMFVNWWTKFLKILWNALILLELLWQMMSRWGKINKASRYFWNIRLIWLTFSDIPASIRTDAKISLILFMKFTWTTKRCSSILFFLHWNFWNNNEKWQVINLWKQKLTNMTKYLVKSSFSFR